MSTIASFRDGQVGQLVVEVSGLGEIVKSKLLRSAAIMYEANRRQGTVKTKTRGETNYTERKPYKQKGTGNARRGDFNSPLLRGGGVIFGPRPRDYSYHLPRKALREAARSALLGKLRDDEVRHLAASGFSKPSTRQAAAALSALGVEGSAVIVIPQENDVIWRSFRNLPRVHVVRAGDLNSYHLLWHRFAVFVDGAWDALVARLGREDDPAATDAGGQPAAAARPQRTRKARAEDAS